MALRLILALAVLAVPLGACDQNKDPARKAAIEEMDRRHTEAAKYKGSM
jgi:hypothetical protein